MTLIKTQRCLIKHALLYALTLATPAIASTLHTQNPQTHSPASPHTNQYNSAFAPTIAKYPTLYQAHGQLILDNYAWLHGDGDEKTKLIEQENAHTAHLIDTSLKDTLSQEINTRSQHTSDELWQVDGIFFKKDTAPFPKLFVKNQNGWQLVLDTNAKKQALNSNTYQLGTIASAPSYTKNAKLAIAYDTVGNELYDIDIIDKNLNVIDHLQNTSGQVVWLDDEQLAYVNGRGNQVLVHKIGTAQSSDTLLYQQTQTGFGLSLHKSSSNAFVLLTIGNLTSAHTLFATPAALLAGDKFMPMSKTTEGVEQYWEHYADKFYAKISSKDGTLLYALDKDDWEAYQKDEKLPRPIFVPTHNRTLESFAFVGDYVIVKVRQQGVHRIFYAKLDDLHLGKLYRPIYKNGTNVLQIERVDYVGNQVWRPIQFSDDNYMVWIKASGFDGNAHFAPNLLRLGYTSPSTPKTVRYYDLTKHRFVDTAKQSQDYQTKRLWVTGKDKTKIPVTLVYKKGFTPHQGNPLLVYGYGAYGISLDPVYGSGYLSLLDRGFVYAFAHIRGGGELGEHWHTDGKADKKQNSIDDFVAVTKSLQKDGYGVPAKTFAMGQSAGAIVIANACTNHHQLYKACVMQVPFLDALSAYHQGKTDEHSQMAEWGNPSLAKDYRTIAQYNPYTSLMAGDYPNTLIIANRDDARVDIADSLKFVAKLRALQTKDSQHLIHIDKGGHTGVGQNSRNDKNALAYTFILQQLQGDTQ